MKLVSMEFELKKDVLILSYIKPHTLNQIDAYILKPVYIRTASNIHNKIYKELMTEELSK